MVSWSPFNKIENKHDEDLAELRYEFGLQFMFIYCENCCANKQAFLPLMNAQNKCKNWPFYLQSELSRRAMIAAIDYYRLKICEFLYHRS